MKIVYVGPLSEGSTCLMRMRALQHNGHLIYSIDTTPGPMAWPISLWSRVARKAGRPLDDASANNRLLTAAREHKPDMVWIDKGLTVWPRTLVALREINPKILIVGYSPDDMGGRHNQSKYFLQGLPHYDIFFTTKTFNVPELKAMGAQRVAFIGNGFDPMTHRPMPVSARAREALGGPVGFIGAWEKDRADQMTSLARQGIPVRMWGWAGRSGWGSDIPNLRVENRPLWGDTYAEAICHFDINLCFLRKQNRDRQTTRSIEIPACGAFMLAERTDEHQALFVEGKEAEFFGSSEELIDKVRYYLSHEDARKQIAAAGRERCLRSGYSYVDLAAQMIKEVERQMQ